MEEKDFSKIGMKNNICINVFGYEDELVFPIYLLNKKFLCSRITFYAQNNLKSSII